MKRVLSLLLATFVAGVMFAPSASAAPAKVGKVDTGIVPPNCLIYQDEICLQSDPDCANGAYDPDPWHPDPGQWLIRFSSVLTCQNPMPGLHLGPAKLWRYTCDWVYISQTVKKRAGYQWVCGDRIQVSSEYNKYCDWPNQSDDVQCHPSGNGYLFVTQAPNYDVSNSPTKCFAFQQTLRGAYRKNGVVHDFDLARTGAVLYGADQPHGGYCIGVLKN